MIFFVGEVYLLS